MNYFYTKSIILIITLIGFTGFIKPETCLNSEKTGMVNFAMAQIYVKDGDREGNLKRVENAIIEAKKQDVDIIVFPEMVLLGWANPDAFQHAHPIPGKDSDLLCQLALKYNIFISIGLAEKDDVKLYDSVILIDNAGNILLKHRKINTLSWLMTPPYARGNEVNVVETKFGTIGLLICADTANNDILNRMKNKKPDILLIPFGWAAKENEWPEHGKELLAAVINTSQTVHCPVIGTNLIGQVTNGPWTGRTYAGLSVAHDHVSGETIIGKDRVPDLVVFSFNVTAY